MHASDSEGNVRGGIQRFLPQWLVRDVILPFVASRLALIVIAWLGFHLLQIPLKGNKWEVENDGYVHRIAGHLSADAYPFVNMWARWDSGWYLDIAEHGYSFVPGKQSNVAFFPLYPDLIRLFHFVVPLLRRAWVTCEPVRPALLLRRDEPDLLHRDLFTERVNEFVSLRWGEAAELDVGAP